MEKLEDYLINFLDVISLNVILFREKLGISSFSVYAFHDGNIKFNKIGCSKI